MVVMGCRAVQSKDMSESWLEQVLNFYAAIFVNSFLLILNMHSLECLYQKNYEIIFPCLKILCLFK